MASDSRIRPRLGSQINPLHVPLPSDEETGYRFYPIFNGSTAGLTSLTCHVSALSHGHCPHAPHSHREEEVLLVLSGEVDVILPDAPRDNQRRHLRPGQFVYYPSYFAHTLQTTSDSPANYMMFKWYADAKKGGTSLGFGHFDAVGAAEGPQAMDGLDSRFVFEGPTAYLQKLHCHVSTLTAGAGYDPHVDAHDVAMIVLDGTVETLGQHVGAHGLIYYAAGDPHGIRNSGEMTAKYLVFEFHYRSRRWGRKTMRRRLAGLWRRAAHGDTHGAWIWPRMGTASQSTHTRNPQDELGSLPRQGRFCRAGCGNPVRDDRVH